MSTTEIDINVLRSVTNAIFDFIQRDLHIQTVKLQKDFYWDVPEGGQYDMKEQPKELDCGSLVDDLGFVLAAHRDNSQSIPLTLAHVAPLLRALSTMVPSYLSPEEK